MASWMEKRFVFMICLIITLKWKGVPANILQKSHRHSLGAHSMPLHRIKRDTQRERPSIQTKSRITQATSPTDPLFPGLGTHYAFLYVGSPSQRVSVIIDTGSYRTAFPCNPCLDCGDYEKYHMSGPFEPTLSSSYVSTGVRVDQRYGEGDGWSGVEAYDDSFIGAETVEEHPIASQFAINYQFYCQDMINGLFVTQYADGIMGMAIKSSSAVPQLVKGGKLEHDAFSLCFAPYGGTMTLGGTADHLWLDSEMQYAALKANSNIFYGVTVKDILIGASSSNYWDTQASIGGSYGGEGSYIIDSGTTLTYLPEYLKEKFAARWYSVTGVPYNTDDPVTEWANVAAFPDITIILKADSKHVDYVAYVIKPEHYLDKYCPAGVQCMGYMGIKFEGSTPILGANFMQGHDVLFDAENMRIGFVEAICDWVGPRPSTAPTASPAPTITFTPTTAPIKNNNNNDANRTVETVLIIFFVTCFFGISFAVSCNALRKYRKEQALARASHGRGVYHSEEGLRSRLCRITATVVDRCVCCPESHQFDKLDDNDDVLSIEIPDKYSGVKACETDDMSEITSPIHEARSEASLKSIAKNSLAHANKFLAAKHVETERPGEGFEF